jgi:hypothetical protein
MKSPESDPGTPRPLRRPGLDEIPVSPGALGHDIADIRDSAGKEVGVTAELLPSR